MRFSNNHTSWNVRAGEIEVWGVKDPTNPTLLNTFVSIAGEIPFLASDFFGSFALDGEEKFLFLSSLDGAIAILDITNPDKFQWEHSPMVIIGSDMQCQDPRALAFDNSTKLLISGWHGQQNGGVDIRDMKDPKNPQYINYCYNDNEQSCLPFTAVALNQMFLCAGAEDTFINIWNIKDPKNPIPIPTLTAHKDSISSLVFWGDFLVSGSNDGIIKIWNLEDQKNSRCIQTFGERLYFPLKAAITGFFMRSL